MDINKQLDKLKKKAEVELHNMNYARANLKQLEDDIKALEDQLEDQVCKTL